jgi:uncharacterized protein (TIGR03437 family)
MRILATALLVCAGVPLFAGSLNDVWRLSPLRFEENRGQADKGTRFLSRGPSHLLSLKPGEAALSLRNKSGVSTLRMSVIGADRAARITGVDPIAAKTNYFHGASRNDWQIGVQNYGRVKYASVYRGIDLIYYGSDQQLEYDFVVAPGADPTAIRLKFAGERKKRIDSNGDLILMLQGTEIRQHKPKIYQTIAGVQKEIGGGYRIGRHGDVTFSVSPYDTNQPLIIDPVVTFATYAGGSRSELGTAVAVDSANNIYVAGDTISSNFPATQGSYKATSIGDFDTFVIKYSPAGAVVYSTYIGGNGEENTKSIAVDSQGNPVVAGFTDSSNFPTLNAAQGTNKGGYFGYDGFVFKLNAAGSDLMFSTYLGGNADDLVNRVVLDSQGNAYVVGAAASSNFPVTVGVFQGSLKGALNATVTKLSSTGTIIYSTFVGGSQVEVANAVSVDNSGNAYVVGYSSSTDFPVTTGAFQTAFRGGTTSLIPQDAFAIKLNPSGQALLYASYIGGSGDDTANAAVVDSFGSLYVAGTTGSTNFPVSSGVLQRDLSGLQDGFIVKLNSTGSTATYSTLIGGTRAESLYGIALDASGQAYVTGGTTSSNFPTLNPIQAANAGGSDAYVAVLKADGSAIVQGTYFGGKGVEGARSIAVDRDGNVIIVGDGDSTDIPATSTAAQKAYGGGLSDAFIAKINFATASATLTAAPAKMDFTGTFGGTVSSQTLAINSSDQKAAWNIEVSATSTWLVANPRSGTGTGSSNVFANPGSLTAGTYSGTLTVVSQASGTRTAVPVTLTLTASTGGQVTQNGVVNAASFKPGAVSAGEIVTVFGSNIGPSQLVGLRLTPAELVDTTLGEVRVLFDGTPAPLIYVASGQLSAIVPYAVAKLATTQMQVEYKGVRSNAVPLQVGPSAPAIFTANSSGTGPGAILNQDSSLNTASTPAAKGSIVILYVTGEGETTPQGMDGQPANSVYPKPILPVTVKIGGVDAEVAYAGAAPGLVAGVMQVNVKVPDSVASGSALPVVVNVGGNSSPGGVTLSVQ